MHRSYDIVGSEVHVDMYDDRLEVYSPGGMADGTLIQECDIDDVPSTRRNPIIAEMFHRLDYIERAAVVSRRYARRLQTFMDIQMTMRQSFVLLRPRFMLY